jgi:sigma-B regulation protein RsbU (phosphoserine phosphatase)
MPAAMFMVRVVTLLRMCVLREQNPADILPAVNRLLCETNEECMFVTLAVALLDTRTGKLTYLNGGHNPPFFAINGQPFQIWKPPAGPLLGFDASGVFSTGELTLQPGDGLVLYSDGVSEAENTRHEQFNVERTASALAQSAPEGDVAGMVNHLVSAITDFAGGAEQSDDMTILALRYRGEHAEPRAI